MKDAYSEDSNFPVSQSLHDCERILQLGLEFEENEFL